MMILEKNRKKCQIWTKNDEEILVTTFGCRLKGEMRTVLHLNRTSPTVISIEQGRKQRAPPPAAADIPIKSNPRLVISNNLHSR
jgi:hypothetical protein